ncbi:cpsf-2 [Pristionchus pacificus]|uniref:Cleavage and polyadenylation specificity factor subunit 2 n=1 Tax=Pristionchus pacificus TaxID=54126 RepID=A0A2A6C8Q2_PRIPA|nr:cpsf-2 [Pristionchus pacificus]|eukprot:PDM74539.1 cpsf-2 [Pristionchus pacificus]
MTSIVKLEALSGAKDDGPLCYLLQVDDVYLLLDCGWDENFDLLYIEAVKKRVPYISAVLLSYADTSHAGALPYLVTKCGLTCPIYATGPTCKMGVMYAYDWLQSHKAVEDFSLFTFDDVDASFERVQQLKYNQTVSLKGDSGLQIVPLPAGHIIGGAIWRISKAGDDEIVYAVDYNHKKERHLNGCLFDAIQRPHLLITDAFNAQYKQPGRKQRDEQLVTKMLRTLQKGGDCLVVIDTAGRVLEIAHLLDQLWSNKDAGLGAYNLVMLSHVASSVVRFAKSQIEWMSDKVMRSFEQGRFNPFQFDHVQLCHSHAEVDRIRSPKVVLCSDISMECGFSRDLFLEWCSDTKNTIILTGRSGERTLGSKLIRMAQGQQRGKSSLVLEIKRRIRLEGAELEEHRARRLHEHQEEARKKMEANRRRSGLAGAKADASDSESDDDDVIASAVAAVQKATDAVTAAAAAAGAAAPIASTPRGSSTGGGGVPIPTTPLEAKPFPAHESHSSTAVSAYDIIQKWEHTQKASFFKQNKKSFPMFGYVEEKVKWDDYGEVIRPEDYMMDAVAPPVVASNGQSGVANGGLNGVSAMLAEAKIKADPDLAAEAAAAAGAADSVDSLLAEEEWPTKCLKYITKLEVMCRVEFIDFEGRSDGESIKKILSQIRPKQLIIVHGDKAATQHLADFAKTVVQGSIFTPKLGEIVDATVESRIFQVALSDALLSSLSFQKVKDAELVWLDAKLLKRVAEDGTRDEEEDEPEEEPEEMEADEQSPGGPVDEMAPPAHKRMRSKRAADRFLLDALEMGAIPPHQAVFVNEPKLSDMRQMLQAAGHPAEFSAGVLHISGVASIKRNDAGRFHVEGCASEKYFQIRDLIYKQFAIV